MRVQYKVGKDIVTFNGYYNHTLKQLRGLTREEVETFVKSCASRKDFVDITILEADAPEALPQ